MNGPLATMQYMTGREAEVTVTKDDYGLISFVVTPREADEHETQYQYSRIGQITYSRAAEYHQVQHEVMSLGVRQWVCEAIADASSQRYTPYCYESNREAAEAWVAAMNYGR